MLEVIPLLTTHIDEFSSKLNRNHLPYHEYRNFSDQALREYWRVKTMKFLEGKNNPAYALTDNHKLTGMLLGSKDEFDSSIFGFECYRINDIIVLCDRFQDCQHQIQILLKSFEASIKVHFSPLYITYSLNNNYPYADHVFNSLTNNHFYYIHTLLTFGSGQERFQTENHYPDRSLTIRQVKKEDSDQIAALAQKSFSFSRFHMDPFLDNKKAGILLSTSAENSVLNGFVDIMYVAEIQDRIIGYYSAKKRNIQELNAIAGEAVISAVDSEFRGQGIFTKLDSHLLNWFADNTDFAEMGTYLANYPVHRTWIEKQLKLIRGSHQFSKFIQ
jgi:hypothetical protein